MVSLKWIASYHIFTRQVGKVAGVLLQVRLVGFMQSVKWP